MKKSLILIFLLGYLIDGIAQELSAASFNIRLKTNSDVGNMWDDRKDPVCDLIRFHEFDIFGIQEAFIEQVQDMQERLTDYSYVGVGRDDGASKGEHSAIFYNNKRFKMLKNGTFWLSDSDTEKPNKGWDAALPRICTWGIFQDKKNGKKLIFMNTHFDHIGVEARRESAKQILSKAKEFAKDLPLILTGDFNIDEKNEAYFTLANSGIVQDAYELAAIKYAPNSTFNGWGKSLKENGRIDHIFITKPFKVLKYGILTDTYMGKFPSDHFPILSVLKW
ncbi:Metal-dependent hydrolase, endonuclease/exonuclease/phosphatase family [Sphingobacterium nematocida]|uniref:Metal-dependent hydrolase, endonuclease/exonuclease/phosphatase family n=1 Tax=Sphingobacterium nematocida TaxID=1513896 RepID=A0A1T5DSH0_9SPHI|nr:endonuclease/exonuclease/phosphatase family protein [Sphingobacterium nematocida]SKB74621.1 Metal-dependent hydrolase, endonuclease/exonuclease/phosphatase family [Sphingobacterium nematocida]